MFLGHYAVALGAKRATRKTSLGTLLMAAQFVDLLWPILLLAGLERVRIEPGLMAASSLDLYDYPITHSLVGVLGWALLFGALYWGIRRSARGAWVLAAVVVSHWVLDLLAHRPDLAIVPGSTARFGLGLWNSLAGTLVVEFGLFALGITLYVRTSVPADAVGRYALWVLIATLSVLYLGSLFGPPPPDARTLAVTALSGWLVVPRGRSAVQGRGGGVG